MPGDFQRWTFFIQVITEAQAKTHRHNPFDLSKVWPKAEYPLIGVGVMELNRWPDNYFAEVEQAAFGPSNVVPSISFSPDRMLQARLFAYNDTVRYRLGVNFYQIPVNAPKCPYMSYHRDGKMRVDSNLGGTTSFNPNSAGLWDNQPDFAEPPLPIESEAAHYNADDDHWEQPRNLFRLMTPAQQLLLFENTARAMGDARRHIKERHIANCLRADPAYGEGVARALGLKIGDIYGDPPARHVSVAGRGSGARSESLPLDSNRSRSISGTREIGFYSKKSAMGFPPRRAGNSAQKAIRGQRVGQKWPVSL